MRDCRVLDRERLVGCLLHRQHSACRPNRARQVDSTVQEYGQRLLPEIYALYNPLTYEEARSLEVELDIDLREGKFGVWQA